MRPGLCHACVAVLAPQASCLSGNAEMRRIEILVGGELNHLEKYESQWDYPIYEYIYSMMENKKCLKPPTRIAMLLSLVGWWYTYPSEKYEFVSWDYDIPN